MIQVLQDRAGPTRNERFNKGVSMGMKMLGDIEGKQQEEQKFDKLKQLTGMDLSGLPPEMQQKAFESSMQRQLQSDKYGHESQKAAEKLRGETAPLEGAMDVLNRMKDLRKKGNLGIGASYSPFGSTRKEAGEYEQLGKSLISYATSIPIRNRLEFETLAEGLYDPNITDATAEGILNAMERILSNSLQSAGGEMGQSNNSNQQRPPLTSFQR